jgi:hypothetical protein
MNIPRRLARIQALEAAAGANDQLTVTVTHVIVGEGPREAYVFTLDGVPTPEAIAARAEVERDGYVVAEGYRRWS